MVFPEKYNSAAKKTTEQAEIITFTFANLS
jgi:hypothetical protein